jgi:site-specific DNA recombinase
MKSSMPATIMLATILLAVHVSMAIPERSLITNRLSGGRKTKAKKGGYAGGGAPIGYVSIRGSGKLTVDGDKIATVKRVFQLRAAMPDSSLQKLAGILNSEGLTTKNGKPFHAMQVKRILDRQDLYEGRYRYAGIDAIGGHEAIL